MHELPLPNDVQADSHDVEVARLWVGKNDLLVSLRIGTFGSNGDEECTAWGDLLADTIRHVAHGISAQRHLDERVCTEQITSRLLESLREALRPMSGSISDTGRESPKKT